MSEKKREELTEEELREAAGGFQVRRNTGGTDGEVSGEAWQIREGPGGRSHVRRAPSEGPQ